MLNDNKNVILALLGVIILTFLFIWYVWHSAGSIEENSVSTNENINSFPTSNNRSGLISSENKELSKDFKSEDQKMPDFIGILGEDGSINSSFYSSFSELFRIG